MRRLTTGIRSEKCVLRQFRRCAKVTECTYTNLDSIAYYIPRLYDTAYCFYGTNLYSMLLYWILQAIVTQWYYNIMGPPSYMRSVVDRNVVMRRIPVITHTDHTFNEAKPTNISSQKTSLTLYTIARCNLQALCEMLRSVRLNISRWHDRYHCNDNINTKGSLKYTFSKVKCTDVRWNGAGSEL
jgi:hypothetical protein